MSNPISTLEELAAIALAPALDYHLTRDLDFNDDGSYSDPATNRPLWTSGDGWLPIDSAFGVEGLFDGNGHTISNLFIHRPTTDRVGLFARMTSLLGNRRIQNLTLTNVNVTGRDYVGAVIGDADYAVLVENCHVTGAVTGLRSFCGGISGYNLAATRCSFSGTVTGYEHAGGIVGRSASARILTECVARNSSITATHRTAGGVAGSGPGIRAVRCSAQNVTVEQEDIDAAFGYVGGFAGWVLAPGGIEDCYATGSATSVIKKPASEDDYFPLVGGFGGSLEGAFDRNYAAVSISLVESLWRLDRWGGFCGQRPIHPSNTDEANFWDTALGTGNSNMGSGLTTSEAKSIAPYLAGGWDIVAVQPGEVDTAHVWNIVEGQSYPFHSWTLTSPVPPPPPPKPEPKPTEPQAWIEIDQDRCAEDCGVTCGGSTVGDEKCYNTWKTCQDRASYTDDTPLTLRFAIANSSLPRGTYVIPSVISKSTSPARANIGGRSSRDTGLGKRGAATVSFHDHPHTDVLVDPYLSERSWDATERGTFWSKWLARNYHEGRPLRVVEGFAGQLLTDYTQRHYVIEHIDGPGSDGTVTIKALDILRLADDDKATAPAASPGALRAGISDAVVPIQIVGGSEILYPAPGVVAIGEEVIAYTTSTDQSYGVQLTGITRGAFGSTAAEHEEGSTAQWCLRYENERPEAIIYDLLTTYGNINPAFIDYPEWEAESLTWDIVETVSRIIPRPEGVASLVAQVCEQSGCYIWWDDRAQQIRFRLLRPLASDEPIIPVTEQGHIVQGTASLVRRPQERASQVWISHRLRSPVAPLRTRDSYLRHRLHIDANAMSPREYDDDTRQEILGAWITDDAQAARLATRALQRIRDTPEYFTFTVPYKDRAIAIGDVIRVTFRSLVDSFGELLSRLFLVISVDEVESGVKTRCEAVLYEFNERYAGFVEDVDQGTGKTWADSDAAERAAFVEDVALTRYNYDTATDDEKLRWVYWAKDVCAEVQGVAPCTSNPAVDPACENCWAFCSDRDNYDATTTSGFADGGKPYAWV